MTPKIWDIRKHSTFERKITGHQGPVFCLDWNPEDKNLIATGGRDRFIQVTAPHTHGNNLKGVGP
jgi:WD40 repeat protein